MASERARSGATRAAGGPEARGAGGRRRWPAAARYLAPAALLAAAALLLQWLDFRHGLRTLSTEAYVLVLALGFTVLGAWLGLRLTRRSPPQPFERNDRALTALGISAREHEVLELLAEGLSNAQIAERLFVSPNTVKTHLSRLYEKLEVSRRTQAVRRARSLRLVP